MKKKKQKKKTVLEQLVIEVKRHYRKIGLGLLILILVICGVILKFKEMTVESEPTLSFTSSSITQQQQSETKMTLEQATKELEGGYVDLKGAINHPGMYPFKDDMRVFDVIELGGGVTKEADLTRLNYAQKLKDQMIVYVYKKGEETLPEEKLKDSPTEINLSEDSSGDKGDKKVSLNTANLEELQTVNGIGKKKAEAIIEFREANGSFKVIDDLKKVKGIGDKTFESLKQSIKL